MAWKNVMDAPMPDPTPIERLKALHEEIQEFETHSSRREVERNLSKWMRVLRDTVEALELEQQGRVQQFANLAWAITGSAHIGDWIVREWKRERTADRGEASEPCAHVNKSYGNETWGCRDCGAGGWR